MPNSLLRRCSLIAVFALLLSACQTVPLPGTSPAPSSKRVRAEQLMEAGNPEKAAQHYERLALQSVGPERDEFWQHAAGAWLLAGDEQKALAAAIRSHTEFPSQASPASQLIAAKLALTRQDIASAERRLQSVPQPIAAELSAAYWGTLAELRFIQGKAADGIDAMIEREAWLNSEESIADNRAEIWRQLQGMMARKQAIGVPKNVTPVVKGWLLLALIADKHGNAFASSDAFRIWRRDYFDHPAIDLFQQPTSESTTLVGDMPLNYPTRIALLLPLSGPFAAAGEAVRDGFNSAVKNTRAQVEAAGGIAPEVFTFDTAIAGPIVSYREALTRNPDVIVGPLTKDELSTLAPEIKSKPIQLGLNYLTEEEMAPRALFQFALAPEHEIRQIARNAMAHNQSRALVVAPDDGWGQRLMKSAETILKDERGTVVESHFYPADQFDHSDWIQALLQVDQSKVRKQELQSVLNRTLEFEPRRRHDIDFIVLIAQPIAGRLIRAQMQFHYANDLPFYALSNVYEADPTNNLDLEGVMFTDLPWVLKPQIYNQQWRLPEVADNDRFSANNRLFAMGFDAYQLVPRLYQQAHPLAVGLQGLTGILTMDRERRISRQLDSATIEKGIAVLTESPMNKPLQWANNDAIKEESSPTIERSDR